MVWMDVCEAEQAPPRKSLAEEVLRPPLVPSEKNNVVSRRPRIREVTSRYNKVVTTSPSLSKPADVPKRFLCPNGSRILPVSSPSFPKRSQSVDRKRPSTPPSPTTRPSTPVKDSSVEMQISSRRVIGGRTPDNLWPSTMRSLCVSFQSDTFSLPITKREKPVSHASSDYMLRPSANVVRKQAETPAVQHKATTPERKRTPLRGRNASDQSENSKPVDNSPAGMVDQHRWPSTMVGGKLSVNALTSNVDLKDKGSKAASLPLPGRRVSPLRRMPTSDSMGKPLQQSASDVARKASLDESERAELDTYSVNDASLRLSGAHKHFLSSVGVSSWSSERTLSITRSSRSQSLSLHGSPRTPSPGKASLILSCPSRGMLSPSRTRPSNPFPSSSSVTSRSSNSTSVLSFIADVRKGKKGLNYIEDAHQLRLLYNRYLQWRYSNSRAEAALTVQKVTAEKTLHNVFHTTSELWDSVTMKRINLQQLRQELALNSVLNEQITYLDAWALLEEVHSSSLSGAIEALEASTLRLPVTGGARADIHTVKGAVSSAVDVMQAMGSSICALLSRVEGMNCLVSELADVAAQERAMLDECGDLLVSTATMQVEENSLITHLIQLKRGLIKIGQPISAIATFV